jgi:PEP-CTERM motif-containing protein
MLYAPAARAAYRPFRGRKTNGFSGALTEELTSLDSVGLVSPVVILGPGGVLAPNVLGYPDSYSGPLVQLQILPSATPGFHGANTFNLTYGSLNGRSVSSNSVAFSVDVASSAIPEPASAGLLTTGLCAFLLWRRRLTSRDCRLSRSTRVR